MKQKLRLFWGADKVIGFRLAITPGYATAGGTLLGAALEFTVGLPGYLEAPLATVASFTYTVNTADLLVGSFVLAGDAYQPDLAIEQHQNLAYQFKISPASGGDQVIHGAAILVPAF